MRPWEDPYYGWEPIAEAGLSPHVTLKPLLGPRTYEKEFGPYSTRQHLTGGRLDRDLRVIRPQLAKALGILPKS